MLGDISAIFKTLGRVSAIVRNLKEVSTIIPKKKEKKMNESAAAPLLLLNQSNYQPP